jgi:hypothetical protein
MPPGTKGNLLSRTAANAMGSPFRRATTLSTSAETAAALCCENGQV